MQFKNKWKRFWTLSRRHEEGFTLVELIVVIAILAILAGVGTVGYSAYVNKANMVADQTRVAEIVNALQLAYYSEGKCEPGALVLTTDYAKIAGEGPRGGTAVDNEFIDNALSAAFGENWRDTLKLSYAKWGEKAQITAYVANMPQEEAKAIASSNYLTNNTSTEMLSAVTALTSAATNVINNYNGDKAAKLDSVVGDGFSAKLEDAGIDPDDEDYATAAANMLVVQLAEQISSGTSNEVTDLALKYASVYAFASATGNKGSLADLNSQMTAAGGINMDIDGWLTSNNLMDDYNAYYYDAESGTGSMTEGAAYDTAAFMNIMGAVDLISDSYTNKEDLTNAGLFSSAKVTDHLDSYINAVNVYSGMTTDEIAALKEAKDAVTILISAAGQVSVTPAEAMPD